MIQFQDDEVREKYEALSQSIKTAFEDVCSKEKSDIYLDGVYYTKSDKGIANRGCANLSTFTLKQLGDSVEVDEIIYIGIFDYDNRIEVTVTRDKS